MESNRLLLIMIGVCLAVIFLMALAKPLQALGRILLHSLFATVGFVVFNLFFASFGLTIGINPLTVLFSGILGLPGFVTMLIIQTILL